MFVRRAWKEDVPLCALQARALCPNADDVLLPARNKGSLEPATLSPEAKMKGLDGCKRKLLLISVLFLCIVLFGELPAPLGADMIANLSLSKKFGMQVKKNLGPAVTMDQTLFNVKLPLKISKMPGPWKNAKLMGMATVYFLDGAGETVGYAISKDGEEGTPLNISLDNGSYNGTVVLPIQSVAGALTGKTCSAAFVVANLGDQTMFIGFSKGGTAPNSGVCAKMNAPGIPPGTIIH
jgi:hypothetical protein